MSETSGSGGCSVWAFVVVAALFVSFIAAIHNLSSYIGTPTPPSKITTTFVLEPVGTFSTDDLNQAATVIRKRLKKLLISSATVEVSGDPAIQVGLPQVDNLDDVLKTLTARGLLEFVDFSDISELGTWAGNGILTTGQGDHPISDQAAKNPVTNKPFVTVMTTSDVYSATAVLMNDQWAVSINFTDSGANTLQAFTRNHIGKALAIVVDGKILSMPVIQSELSEGATITGNFTDQSAHQLAIQIGGGALPFEMTVRSMQSASGIPVGMPTPTSAS
jgi:preprotein translocase subunit SecD